LKLTPQICWSHSFMGNNAEANDFSYAQPPKERHHPLQGFHTANNASQQGARLFQLHRCVFARNNPALKRIQSCSRTNVKVLK
jgi:hypothetical protein